MPARTTGTTTTRRWAPRSASCPRSSRPSSPANSVSGTASSSWAAATGATRCSSPAYGHEVIGIDASHTAIEACRRLAETLGEDRLVRRRAHRRTGPRGSDPRRRRPRIVYARFFLHAITEAEEEDLLDLAAALTEPGDLLAVEYRTVRDSSGAKVTKNHYRRFVLPAAFEARALGRGFDVIYSVEGFGFAKYRQDDAYVARTIFRRHAS